MTMTDFRFKCEKKRVFDRVKHHVQWVKTDNGKPHKNGMQRCSVYYSETYTQKNNRLTDEEE